MHVAANILAGRVLDPLVVADVLLGVAVDAVLPAAPAMSTWIPRSSRGMTNEKQAAIPSSTWNTSRSAN